MVFDGDAWQARLPALVAAVFLPIHGDVKHWEGGDARSARDVRDRFAAQYGLHPAERVPVLTYDLGEAAAGRAPFAEMEGSR